MNISPFGVNNIGYKSFFFFFMLIGHFKEIYFNYMFITQDKSYDSDILRCPRHLMFLEFMTLDGMVAEA